MTRSPTRSADAVDVPTQELEATARHVEAAAVVVGNDELSHPDAFDE
jgi:hypothetical protein